MGNILSTTQRLHETLGNIIRGLKPGDRLPSEPKLANQLGVSRSTLREAMRTYETQGIIRRKQGAGTYVMHPSPVIESGLEVLESIETLAKRIGLNVSMGEIQIDNRKASHQEQVALNLPESCKVISIARIILTSGGPAAYLIDILPEGILETGTLQTGFSGSVLDLLIKRGEPELLSSRCEVNAVQAPAEIAKKLGIQRGDVLLRMVAWLYNTNGCVIDYSFSYFLPGYFSFHVVRRIGAPIYVTEK